MSNDTTPQSLKGNLLNARDRLGETIIEIVARDVAAHGEEVIAALRKQNPAAYARLISDLVHFKKLATERAPKKEPDKPQRKPRELRIKDLLKAMDEAPIAPNNPMLPPKHRERWIQADMALRPRTAWNLTPEELRKAWGEDLAEWFERNWRKGQYNPNPPPRPRTFNHIEVARELSPGRTVRLRLHAKGRRRRTGPQMKKGRV